MNFKEFYKLLDEAITKDESDIMISDENYNPFIFNRYLSFYHPQIAILLAKTTNRVHWIPDGENEEMSFKCMKGILPKLPKAFIQYIKKPAVVAAQELEITEDEIKDEAMYLECSKREIRNLILEIEKDLTTDYAKRS